MRFTTCLLLIAALTLATQILPSCSTSTGDAAKDRAGRVTNATLQSAADFTGRVALATLTSAAQSAAGGQKIDLAHSAAAGLWSQSTSIASSADVQRVVSAWSGDQLGTVADASAAAYRQADPRTAPERTAVVNALAGALSTAAFDATGLP